MVFNEHAPVIEPIDESEEAHHLVSAILNSSGALLWLKQICFNKGAGEEEQRDRFELQPGKVQQLPIPSPVAEALRGKPHSLAERLTALSCACWERGRKLPSLALRKLFEKSGEAYHAWNTSLPGHVAPHAKLRAPFTTASELQERFASAVFARDQLCAEMIALQEEMDWLVYRAYGLSSRQVPDAAFNWSDPAELSSIKPLAESERAFRLWANAGGDFDKAHALIPAGNDWPAERRVLWEARLQSIRDNEHIRRIEQPVYKRRWDEQWKVSNRWMAGRVAYAQEFVDAFRWWIAEKAEWHLENKAKGGPIELETWTNTLWKDPRIQAAWPVVAEAILTVARWKFENAEKQDGKKEPKLAESYEAFAKFFKETVQDESVPDGIPPAIPWDDLVGKKKWTTSQLKKAQAVRGKLNVPRERFRQQDNGSYIWAGKAK